MAAKVSPHFRPQTFAFLRDLSANNRRDWFQDHKSLYEETVKEPALRFISDFGPQLSKICSQFTAVPRAVGGSLFRIYRDVRFSQDKSPYKTNCAMQFRHKQGRDVHAPGFYLSLAPGEVYVGAGIYHPSGPALLAIREAIATDSKAWRAIFADPAISGRLQLGGESLLRAPRGFDPAHPLIDDIKRKDFYLYAGLTEKDACAPGFLERYTELCGAAKPLMRFLCKALDLPF